MSLAYQWVGDVGVLLEVGSRHRSPRHADEESLCCRVYRRAVRFHDFTPTAVHVATAHSTEQEHSKAGGGQSGR